MGRHTNVLAELRCLRRPIFAVAATHTAQGTNAAPCYCTTYRSTEEYFANHKSQGWRRRREGTQKKAQI